MSPVAESARVPEHGTASANLSAVYGAAKALGRDSLYLNLGYWADGVRDYDQAAEALVDQVAAAARIGQADVVLDPGFGFGDQDLRWAKHLRPKQIIGVNVIPKQVAVARRRVDEAGLSGVVELHQADANRLPVQTGAVSRVVAVESALHFDTRATFFAEAWRVLAHGGRIALADIVPRPGPQHCSADRRWPRIPPLGDPIGKPL
jgi:ubiquinone/menaquinone biosynthesis C-methylase UbiE